MYSFINLTKILQRSDVFLIYKELNILIMYFVVIYLNLKSKLHLFTLSLSNNSVNIVEVFFLVLETIPVFTKEFLTEVFKMSLMT